MSRIITVKNLSKEFTFSVKNDDRSFLSNWWYQEVKTISAVNNINFNVDAGETVAFIGPNGAGKSTTIKMLTGILHPTAGQITVDGLEPTVNRQMLAYRLGTVFGQRSQLFPNLPVIDSFEFFGTMYNLTSSQIKQRTAELIDIFGIGDFAAQPVRKLSLGQRMRAEVAVALVHEPKIIFLDEPTIGLDVVAKNNLRQTLKKLNTEKNITIFLTSHDVGDIESLCARTILINHGQIMADQPTPELAKLLVNEKFVSITLSKSRRRLPKLPSDITVVSFENNLVVFKIDLHKLSVAKALELLLPHFDIDDLTVYDTDLETVIRKLYEKSVVA